MGGRSARRGPLPFPCHHTPAGWLPPGWHFFAQGLCVVIVSDLSFLGQAECWELMSPGGSPQPMTEEQCINPSVGTAASFPSSIKIRHLLSDLGGSW